MIAVADYLMENYYTKYAGCPQDMIPLRELLLAALEVHNDKVITVLNGDTIVGVAVFAMLEDETFANLESYDLKDVNTLAGLLREKGKNIHFIILAAKGLSVIMKGIEVTKRMKPKTMSWWNPTMTRLHKYNLQ